MRKQSTEERTIEYIQASFEQKMQALGPDIDREKVVITFGGVKITGYATDEFISVPAREETK